MSKSSVLPRYRYSQQPRESENGSAEQRIDYIIETFMKNFGSEMQENPKGWKGRFRKMAASEFAFYRGSAVLFYRDMQRDRHLDPWLRNCAQANTVFIHGDLHAENFGTYIDRRGIINFDVNDFDEGYVGPFTWDIKRLVASLNVITFAKAFNDEQIENVIRCVVRSYLEQVYTFYNSSDRHHAALTIDNTEGPVNTLLKESRLGSKEAHLDTITKVENFERTFIRSTTVKSVDHALYNQLMNAFQYYVQTIPESKKEESSSYKVKDIVARASPGIGSAGRISYNILVQGKTQALESDVIIYMKPAKPSAVASVIDNPTLDQYFKNDGLRTVLCAYAMHAVTSRWLGYSILNNQIPLFVDDVATHSKDLDWTDINDFNDVCQTAEYLGKAMAKIHCVADTDTIDKHQNSPHYTDLLPFNIIPRHTERTIIEAIQGKNEDFIQDMIAFGMNYGEVVRRDHQLFFEAFRSNRIPIVNANNPQQ